MLVTPVRPMMSAMTPTTNIDSIEQHKENIQPLSQGRSAKALSNVFTQEGHTRSKALAEGHAAFAKELEAIDELDDPLEVFTRYIKWTVENYPQGHNHESNLIPLLERTTRTLKDDHRYKADPRYLKCWVLYSKYVESAKEVFVFLLLKEIGTTLATLYEEYATVLEGKGLRADAEAIYKLGIARSAQPLERLNKRYRQYLARIATQPLTNDDVTPDTNPRDAHGRRSLLGPGSERSVLGSRTPLTVSRAQSGTDPNGSSKAEKLQIFDDSAVGHASRDQGLDTPGVWADYGTMTSRRKENLMDPSPWDGEKLSMKKPARAGRTTGRLEIFRDESEEDRPRPLADQEDFIFRGPNKSTEAELLMRNPFKNYDQAPDLSVNPLVAPSREARVTKSVSAPAPREKPKAAQAKVKLPEKLAIDLDLLFSDGQELCFEELHASVLGLLGKVWTDPQDFRIPIKDLDGPNTPADIQTKTASLASPTVNTKAALADIMDMFNQPLEGDSSDSDDDSSEDGDVRDVIFGSKIPFTGTPYVDSPSISALVVTPRVPIFSDENAVDLRQPTTPASRNVFRAPFGQSTQATQETLLSRPTYQSGDAISDVSDSQTPNTGDHIAEFDAPLIEETAEQQRPRARRGRFNDINLMTPIAESTSEFSIHSSLRKLRIHDAESPNRPPETPVPVAGVGAPLPSSSLRPTWRLPAAEEATDESSDRIRNKIKRRRPWDPPNPCNPHDERYLNAVLSRIDRPLQQIPGFVDCAKHTSGKLSELRKRAKLQASRASTVSLADTEARPWQLQLDETTYAVQCRLGEGAFGSVYLCIEERESRDDQSYHSQIAEDPEPEAIKVQKPADTWEFFILKELEDRLEERARASVIQASRLYCFADESFLVLDYHEQGTLLDIVNHAGVHGLSSPVPNGGLGLDETLAMFLAIELLRTIEALHEASILHGDLKIDNCLVRLPSPTDATTQLGDYDPSGRRGWSEKGIVLIDFGRAIDLSMFPEGQSFVAEWETDKDDCFEMREMRPWTYQADYFGLAGIINVMLFGRYMETTLTTVSSETSAAVAGSDRRYRLTTPWKRYWQVDLWNALFDALLNPRLVNVDGSLPITASLKTIRGKMEDFLAQNGQRNGRNLKMLLRRLESAVSRRRDV